MTNATCSIAECENAGKITRGLCMTHYQRIRKQERFDANPCSIAGCTNPGKGTRAFCQTHQYRLDTHGDVTVTGKGKKHKVQYDEAGLRICKSCNLSKPLTEYHADKGGTDGYRAQCKPCRNSYMSGYYTANRESRVAYEQHRRTNRADHMRALDMARYERHKDKRIALATESVHIRRARMMNAEYDKGITDTALRKIHGDNCCYCGVIMDFMRGKRGAIKPTRATIEHILPISKGGTHTWANTTLACHRCNVSKNARTVDEWSPRSDDFTNRDRQVEEPQESSSLQG